MRPDQAYSTYLTHIAEAIERSQRYLRDMRFEKFTTDERTCDATVRVLEIIGEVTSDSQRRFAPSTRAFHGAIWRGRGTELSLGTTKWTWRWCGTRRNTICHRSYRAYNKCWSSEKTRSGSVSKEMSAACSATGKRRGDG